jgi:hypothetical protein
LPTPAALFAYLIFGVIGFAAFTFGRRGGRWKQMGIGLALMLYPYFVSDAWPLYLIGFALCGALYYWRGD